MKIRKLTRVSTILLGISCVLWIGAIICIFIGYGQILESADENSGMGVFAAIMQLLVAEVIIISSVARPAFFAEMFSAQAKGKIRGVVIGAVLLAAWLVYAYKDIVESVIHGAAGDGDLIELLTGLVIPVLTIFAILLSSRPLAIIMAVLSLGATVVAVLNATVISSVLTLNGVNFAANASSQVKMAISIFPVVAEILYGIGMFLGLLGVKKTTKLSN